MLSIQVWSKPSDFGRLYLLGEKISRISQPHSQDRDAHTRSLFETETCNYGTLNAASDYKHLRDKWTSSHVSSNNSLVRLWHMVTINYTLLLRFTCVHKVIVSADISNLASKMNTMLTTFWQQIWVYTSISDRSLTLIFDEVSCSGHVISAHTHSRSASLSSAQTRSKAVRTTPKTTHSISM